MRSISDWAGEERGGKAGKQTAGTQTAGMQGRKRGGGGAEGTGSRDTYDPCTRHT